MTNPTTSYLQYAASYLLLAGGHESAIHEQLQVALQAIADASIALQAEPPLITPVSFPTLRIVHIYENQAAKDAGHCTISVERDVSQATTFYEGKTLPLSREGDQYFALRS